MADLPPARSVLTTAPERCYDLVVLGYDERLLRRRRLVTVHDEGFLVDLPMVTNMDDHWGFLLEDGRAVQVVAAEESLVQITGPDLLRYAWHIGNRHTPCQIEPDRLLIRADHVLEAMLAGLGATLAPVTEPFTPEGGAYGHGRTMGHSHGPEGHSPDGHGHDHGPETFGWHDHGDGHVHFHAPAAAAPSLPFGHKKAT
ncbi:urease accessory protein UreE [Xinfangfangia pollutisoli]|uniref:urease accessory protein UreE n=1 Tax=Xinfangfangia pollutisoli TaxID=2865960 RepID=UPI001CD49621|nr:urease accessory protein UreE [Xinfangfangia pollutisoli]